MNPTPSSLPQSQDFPHSPDLPTSQDFPHSSDFSQSQDFPHSSDFPYEDIVNLSRPVHDGDEFSYLHPKMEREDRAKIFAPFAALKGFEESIDEKTEANTRE